ncbi:putative general negative regulator of transcription subunit 1 [Amylocarpus encephaloides]|uniref:General negative regulator of transcription subunit 1 n=1 Tax=Amylocarpus encephaloides TaxID=45428 RepID=A0A9P7Y971_9HELO|nr:putative general negative regulator of transcription subunit 1 [Amylocarpus encephaloides]
MVNSRGGTFTPSAQQTIVTGVSHSPHSSHHSTFSTGASPSTSSPTGSNSLTKIVVAQVYLLLSTIKEDKDRTKWEEKAEQLRKLIDDHSMEVFQKYFSRLVAGNAPKIFPAFANRPVANPANYQILVNEVQKVALDAEQAGKIAESIESANEDVFRDFDLSTFMQHFQLDALEKTILALAFKTGSRGDLRTKSDAILSANFSEFTRIIARPLPDRREMSPEFLATMIDRFIQEHPPNFDNNAREELDYAVRVRYSGLDVDPTPTEVLSALYLMHSLNSRNTLVLHLKRTGSAITTDEDTCTHLLKVAEEEGIHLDEEQVAAALIYATISQTPTLSLPTLVNSLRDVLSPNTHFSWPRAVSYFDRENLRITPKQFLTLYYALQPLAQDGLLDIQQLWGGRWQNSETQLSFIGAFLSLSPEELDASSIQNLTVSFTLEEFTGAEPAIYERAARAIKHPLISTEALSAMFHAALQGQDASETVEAKRLFQGVVVPNLDFFLVSAFGVPKPWPEIAVDTINTLFNRFLYKMDPNYDFVLDGLWRKDKHWVAGRLVDAHAKSPLELTLILEHAIRHKWLTDLTSMLSGFGLDLTALAHSRGYLDLEVWAASFTTQGPQLARSLITFLNIKAQHELEYQQDANRSLVSTMLPVKTIYTLLVILGSILPKAPAEHDLIVVQRTCITAYPRLINYGEGYDDIIDENGKLSHQIPRDAQERMEEHYKRMYNQDLEPRDVVDALQRYKTSRDPAEQDVFACMIHGLFDEYSLYGTYPLEALATTAVLFGGIIQHRLISEIPLEIGLGMILEAVEPPHHKDDSMFKFGCQALQGIQGRLLEWPGFCNQLLQISALHGTQLWHKAQEVWQNQEERLRNGFGEANDQLLNNGAITNGNIEEILSIEPTCAPFDSLWLANTDDDHETPLPSSEVQEKVQFLMNNITAENLEEKFVELQDMVEEEIQPWFASLLVEQRAKREPNNHQQYLSLVKLMGRKSLYSDILHETYISAFRLLNSESVLNSQNDRSLLLNLATWLGHLTLARDRPIKHQNIAFKQLLLEAYDSKRLIAVIPFVCRVLSQGKLSTVFKPPNPWIMDIIQLLLELYQHASPADIKLNQKFAIEVLCSDLEVDRDSIETTGEILNRAPIEEATDVMAPEVIDRFENLSINGIAPGLGSGRFSPEQIARSLPDLGPDLVLPPANDMVNQPRLHEILRTAISRAVAEIISPVVERSVTIAAISTAQMIHKDFATEPNEERVRAAAINMVKRTAGSLALVTSKEPLRASMANYIRSTSGELSQDLPEGTILMCVTSNLDLACRQVENKAEERAVPEIEEMLDGELERRRQHRLVRPDQEYYDPELSRWSWTIPDPYKLRPSIGGLNQEQMAIYDEFARQPRPQSLTGATHVATSSDATRSMANEILQEQYSGVPHLTAPAEPQTISHINHQLAYAQPNASMVNGRLPAPLQAQMDPRAVIEKFEKTLIDIQRLAAEASEQYRHFADLPRPHSVIDYLDHAFNLVVKCSQTPGDLDLVMVEKLCEYMFRGSEHDKQDTLLVESLVTVLTQIYKIGGKYANRIALRIGQQPNESLLNAPLATALIKAGMLEWHRVDAMVYRTIQPHKGEALEFLSAMVDEFICNENQSAMRTDLARSLEVAWCWIEEDPSLEAGQQLKALLGNSNLAQPNSSSEAHRLIERQFQMEYVFEEWIHLYSNNYASEKASWEFISRMYNSQVINSRDDLLIFLRISIDSSVEKFEQMVQTDTMNDAYTPVDSLARFVAMLVKQPECEGEVKNDRPSFLGQTLSLSILVLNHHHLLRAESFNQKVFFRFFSTLLSEMSASNGDGITEHEHQKFLLSFARNFLKIQPEYFSGFVFAWFGLIAHRDFMPNILRLPRHEGWEPFAKIMDSMLLHVGNLLKPLHLAELTKRLYGGVLKILVVLQHDFPEFVSANHSRLCANIPSHCIQLHNLILNANPAPYSKMPDPLQPGLKIDRIEEIRDSPTIMNDVETPLLQRGLLEVINDALRIGPSEDAVAHIAHAIQQKNGRESGLGFVPINVDRTLIEALVIYVGLGAIAKATSKNVATFTPNSPDAALLTMLVHELRPEARYYLIGSLVDQLRFPNNHTHYFSQALLEIFGHDMNDQEESDVRQQITRVLLERLAGQWPQPWGLIVTVHELVKNEKYMFFELPFIKSASPDVAERFGVIAARPYP